ncbi:MAG: twin-arginine translocase TatA/TatE family subunit [Clostridia bacterium]|nr:twin-arginine translocase TatA/TatE family subunit [Clostridia bacterium]
MFNIGMMELILVLLVAFLVVGPKDLPKVARWVARQIKSIRRLVREVKKETGWDEFTAEFRDTKEDLKRTFEEADVSGDVRDAADEISKAACEVKQSVDSVRKDVDGAAKELRGEIGNTSI